MHKVLIMSELKKTVGIIGLGLIGGSMAIDLKKRGFAGKVLGVEADKVAAQAAMTIGLADEMVSLEDCVDRSDIIVLAVPVGAAVKMLPEILDRIHSGAEAPSSASLRDPIRANAPETPSLPAEDPGCPLLEPSARELLAALLPRTLKLKLYAALLDSAAAEHAARTIAMQTATDNAENLLSELTLQYNKGRQQKITSEILDLAGGQAAE